MNYYRNLYFGFTAFVIAFAAIQLFPTAAERVVADNPPEAKQLDNGEPPIASTCFVVFPQDCNANFPMLFGGKVLAEMDRCAGIAVRRTLYQSPLGIKDAVTIAINNVKFHKGAKVKDLVIITGRVTKVGEKTITIQVEVMRELANKTELLVEGEFVFCAFDVDTQKAVIHGLKQ